MNTRWWVWLLCASMACGVFADDPVINIISVKQQWPWSRKVNIDFQISCSEAVDLTPKVFDGNELQDVPFSSFSGDLWNVSSGTHRIVWDPLLSPAVDGGSFTRFRVAFDTVRTPLYMIVDLDKSADDPERLEYVYEAELTNGVWGAWERDPIANLGTPIRSVIWTGVTTNNIYKTDKMVFRRVNPGTFMMGGDSGTTKTTLTRGFYIGVFSWTQAQYTKITGLTPGSFSTAEGSHLRALCAISYNTLRGTDRSVKTFVSFAELSFFNSMG